MAWKYTSEIISLQRPTNLDKLAVSIPKPEGAIPNFGLPKWKIMSLECKIPMIPAPEGTYIFTRQKIGKRLWIGSPNAEFDLHDPYGYEIKLDYNPLHDQHLVPFFSRENNIRHLHKAGLITADLRAKCSLQEYNQYRKYLRKLHCETMKRELKRRDQIAREQRHEDAKLPNVQKKEERATANKLAREKIKLEAEAKMKYFKERALWMQERLRLLEYGKQEDLRLSYAKRKAHADYITEKLKTAATINRYKKVHILLKWRKKEISRKKEMELRTKSEIERKKEMIKEKWNMKEEFQKNQLEKENFLVECINSHQQKCILEYDEKMMKERQRMQKLFEKTKMYISCYLASHLPTGKILSCCKKPPRYTKDTKPDKETQLLCLQKFPHSMKRDNDKTTQKIIKKLQKPKKGKITQSKLKSMEEEESHSVPQENVIEAEESGVMEQEPEPTEVIELMAPEVINDKCTCNTIKDKDFQT